MPGVAIAGVGVLTGWGPGIAALPGNARGAAGGRRVVPLATPRLDGDRFRRATRECLLGVAAVATVCEETPLARDALRGDDTALVHVTAGAYGASNRAFIDADTRSPDNAAPATGSRGTGALQFPYTAPSALTAEVAIEFGLTGHCAIFIGGAAVTLEALWYAGRLLAQGAAARVLVLAVETFAECEDLYDRGRWLTGRPLVEAAACALLVPGREGVVVCEGTRASTWETEARRRAGETLACEPLIALALARAAGVGEVALTAQWRGRRAEIGRKRRAPTPAAAAE